jgi:YgiT-type zinc finger domain-containing protein
VKSSSGSATAAAAKPSSASSAARRTAALPKQSPKSASPAGSSSSPSTSVERRCAHCGDASIQLKHVTRSFGRGADLLVIESIPLWSCARCGEAYFTAQTMHEIERIKALRHAIAVERRVPVVAFAEAA